MVNTSTEAAMDSQVQARLAEGCPGSAAYWGEVDDLAGEDQVGVVGAQAGAVGVDDAQPVGGDLVVGEVAGAPAGNQGEAVAGDGPEVVAGLDLVLTAGGAGGALRRWGWRWRLGCWRGRGWWCGSWWSGGWWGRRRWGRRRWGRSC